VIFPFLRPLCLVFFHPQEFLNPRTCLSLVSNLRYCAPAGQQFFRRQSFPAKLLPLGEAFPSFPEGVISFSRAFSKTGFLHSDRFSAPAFFSLDFFLRDYPPPLRTLFLRRGSAGGRPAVCSTLSFCNFPTFLLRTYGCFYSLRGHSSYR